MTWPFDNAQLRTDLNVPYGHKDLVKERGAKWDPTLRTWYVIGDTANFTRWLKPKKKLGLDKARDELMK